jgi:hypothetical protein
MFLIQVEKCCNVKFELKTKIKAKKNMKAKKKFKFFFKMKVNHFWNFFLKW